MTPWEALGALACSWFFGLGLGMGYLRIKNIVKGL